MKLVEVCRSGLIRGNPSLTPFPLGREINAFGNSLNHKGLGDAQKKRVVKNRVTRGEPFLIS